MINRILPLPEKSFLLLGPRGTGKSTWLKQKLKASVSIDLLKSAQYLSLNQDPAKLESLTAHLKPGDWVLIDEIQRIPKLLYEVHSLYENKRLNFALSGSSARKLKREGADLLGGRALRKLMFPLVYEEYKKTYSVSEAIEWGTLPLIVTEPKYRKDTLSTYLEIYIKEEIVAEAIIRKLDPFVRFLQIAGLFNAQLLNMENISREAQVKRNTVEHYFQILEDTLIGTRLLAYQPKLKTKEIGKPKFYFFDSGVARSCAGLLDEQLESIWKGYAFETLILNELKAYIHYSGKNFSLSHYTVGGSYDIDFLVQTKKRTISSSGELICIEVKYSKKFDTKWCAGLNDFASLAKTKTKHKLIIYRGHERLTHGKIDIYPAELFLKRLHEGKFF